MTKRAAIEADFSTFRPVAGRKVLQLVFEVPIENAEKVMSVLGYPVPGQSKWCGIAPLATEADKAGEVSGSNIKPHKKWNDLPYSQQAAIRCGEAAFQEYIIAGDSERAAEKVRLLCEVESRRNLDTFPPARLKWQVIEAEYQAWLTDRKYSGARHG